MAFLASKCDNNGCNGQHKGSGEPTRDAVKQESVRGIVFVVETTMSFSFLGMSFKSTFMNVSGELSDVSGGSKDLEDAHPMLHVFTSTFAIVFKVPCVS